jgi:ribosome-associated protein
MAKRMSSITGPSADATPDDEPSTGRASYRERSDEASAISGLVLLLIAMKPSQLAALSLDPEVLHAVVQCQGFTKGARARQLRLIAKLLRQHDHEALRTAVTHVMRGKGARSQREKTYEKWRERLLSGGDAAVTEFAAQHPGADVQKLRQLIRLAGRDPTKGKGKAASRDVLRLVRELGEAGATPTEAADAPDDDDESID